MALPYRRKNISLKEEELVDVDDCVDGKYHKYISADAVDSELTLLLTVTVLQSTVIVSFFAFYSYQDLVAFDEENTYLTYRRATFLTPFIWTSIQFNVVPFFLSWIVYMSWRFIRPHPSDTAVSRKFYRSFGKLISSIYVVAVIGFLLMSVSFYHIAILKAGGTQNAVQSYNYSLGIVYLISLGVCVLYSVYRVVQVKSDLNNVVKTKLENENAFNRDHLPSTV